MANASKDDNGVSTLIAALDSDGATIVKIQGSPTNHGLEISDNSTGTDHGPIHALHDDNDVPTLLAVSSQTTTVNGVSYIQGITPVVIYADSSGNLLVQST